jgi:hypothetical protein
MPEIANFAVAANKDGLLEIVALAGPTTDDQQFTGAVWLTRELPASPEGQDQWTPAWRSLGTPGGGQLAGITLARNSDGRPWEPWTLLRPEPAAGEPALAVSAQAGGRLVLFALRNTPEGSQSLEKLEQEATDGEKWLPGDPIDTVLLGLAEAVPKADNPALAIDSRGRLRLFLSVAGRIGIYALNQTNPAGEQWLESINFFEAP